MEELAKTTERTVAENWLQNIFNSLMRLQSYERMAKEGCEDILEYVQIPPKDMPKLQYKNYSLFMTEFSILLNDIKNFADKEKHKKILIDFYGLREFEKKEGGFLGQRDQLLHQQTKVRSFFLKDSFYVGANKISELRSMLIDSIWKILSPSFSQENLNKISREERT